MKPFSSIAIAPYGAVLLLAAAAPAQADHAPAVQAQTEAGVLATEALWAQALQRRDTTALDRLLADDFMDTTWQGLRRPKSAVLKGLATNGPQPMDLGEMVVRLYGGAAIVRGLNTIHASDGSVRARIRFTDVFIYQSGAWRAISAQETLEQGASPP